MQKEVDISIDQTPKSNEIAYSETDEFKKLAFMENPDDILIKVRNLKKTYFIGTEKVKALNGINLDIKKGEILVILGTSGSGKSTFLNMLAGLEKPTNGSIYMFGDDVSKMNESKLAKFRQNHMGFIFQSYNLMSNLTAIENVALPLTFKRYKTDKRLKEAAHLLNAVGLKSHMLHKPTQMSGGQQQRVGIARAFAGKPKLIFADEPTGNLDSKTTLSVLKLMLDMCRKNNQTLILVTHDPGTANYGDRVIHIIDGMIDKITINNQQGVSNE